MATLTKQDITLAGLKATLVAADVAGDKFPADSRTFLRVANGAAVSIDVTLNSQQLIHNTDVDPLVAVPAGDTMDIGPFPSGRFKDADGNANVTYSAVTDITVAAVRLTEQGY